MPQPPSTRRDFLKTVAALGAGSLAGATLAAGTDPAAPGATYAPLDAAASRPVLNPAGLGRALVIASVDFLRHEHIILVRVRTRDGAEGIAVSNELDMGYLIPVARELIVPGLIGRDARDWESLIEEIYLRRSNYKRQGLLFWLPFASLEFAVLDLLSRAAGQSVTTLLGGRTGGSVEIYHAHDDRTRSAEESVERMLAVRDRYRTRASKFKVGGRMSANAEARPGRSAAIIRLARERFGPAHTLYADSNGSFDVPHGIAIGRLCEEHGIAIFEEPVPHDMYEETRAVADALAVPVAGGEQESSHNRFRWMIARRALDVVQPDLFYFGGLVRSIRVARMAHAAGLTCSPHISGTGLGMLYMLHFVSCIPNPGPFQEYKGFDPSIRFEGPRDAIEPTEGVLRVPTGPGFGIHLDPAFLSAASPV